jgi:diadenylate cyclase
MADLTLLQDLFVDFSWRDAADIGIMTAVVYQGYKHFHGTRAARVLGGLALLGLSYMVAQSLGLFVTSWVLGGVWAAVLLSVIVIFQTEIRDVLERFNRPVWRLTQRRAVQHPELSAVADAAFAMAAERVGALIVIERSDDLERVLRRRGVTLNADISADLLAAIFYPGAPLHDGAARIRSNRILDAGSFLPLSEASSLPTRYGTRHRAAVGITEISDALAVVVSEERGAVSAVSGGQLQPIADAPQLLAWLQRYTSSPRSEPDSLPNSGWSTALRRNWRSKLVSAAVVILAWAVLVGPKNAEVAVSASLVYQNLPSDLRIQSASSDEVLLRVRGSRELIRLLNPERVRVAIDLRDAHPGQRQVRIERDSVSLPLGLRLVEVKPRVVRLILVTADRNAGGKESS